MSNPTWPSGPPGAVPPAPPTPGAPPAPSAFPGLAGSPAPASAWGANQGGWGAASGPPAGPPIAATPARSRLLDGLLLATAAAILAGLAWWGICAALERQIIWAAIAVGAVVGRAMVLGSRRGGLVQGIAAFALTVASLAVAEYFIQRSIAISRFGANVPLWTDFGTAQRVVRSAVDDQPLTAIMWLIAGAVALVTSVSKERSA